MIALLNLSVLGFSFVFVVFHDKAKRTQQRNLLVATLPCVAKFSPNEFSADTMGVCLMPRREG